MKNKNFTYLITSICAITILAIIGISFFKEINNKNENKIDISKKVTDECTEEWDEYTASLVKIASANSEEKVISPNAKMVFNNYYKSCGHIETTEELVEEKIVNMNEEQVKNKYLDYDLKSFSKDEISFYREIDGLCDKHYLLIEENRYLAIYKLEKNGDKSLISKTNISSEYLTDNDNVRLKQGIYVYGLDELNRTLEDFE